MSEYFVAERKIISKFSLVENRTYFLSLRPYKNLSNEFVTRKDLVERLFLPITENFLNSIVINFEASFYLLISVIKFYEF